MACMHGGTAPADEGSIGAVRVLSERERQQYVEPDDVEREDTVVCKVRREPRAPLLKRFHQPRHCRFPGARGGGACSVPACGTIGVPAIVSVAQ